MMLALNDPDIVYAFALEGADRLLDKREHNEDCLEALGKSALDDLRGDERLA